MSREPGDLIKRLSSRGSISGHGDLIERYEQENAEIEAREGEAPTMRNPAAPFLDKLRARCEARYSIKAKCESPIEIALATDIIVELGSILTEHDIELRPQFKWRRWRMDFAMVKAGSPVLFIECDGREYHSTPAQLANDKQKDDAAASAGITLLRFSGTEIYKYTDGCVHRVLEYLVRVGAV